MNEASHAPGHDELSLLLPWYVNATLGAAEAEAVGQHLEVCAECRDGVALLSRMRTAVSNESPSPIVPRRDVEALFEQLDAGADAVPPAAGWLTPRALVAAAAIVAVGIALLFAPREPGLDDAQLFETATTANPVSAQAYVLAMEFVPQTSDEERRNIIAAVGGTEIGPGAEPNTHRVAVTVQAATLEQLAGFTSEIESNPAVTSVRVVAVQLPVE